MNCVIRCPLGPTNTICLVGVCWGDTLWRLQNPASISSFWFVGQPLRKNRRELESRPLVQATPHVFGQSFLLPCLNHLIDGMRSVKAFARSSPSGAAPEDTSSKLDKSNWSISGLLAKNNTVGGTRAAWVTCGNRNTHICPILQNTVLMHLTPLRRPLWGNSWVIKRRGTLPHFEWTRPYFTLGRTIPH